MVLGVCRRVLHNEADAEDAFQAAFLLLVRKAASLASRAVLADWLHGVARRTALNAKRLDARRRAKEQAMARPEAQGEEVRDYWLPVLDEELGRLAEKHRLPIVLCDLEGRTRREAAEQLGWPEGTVAGRLARGRKLLARRLARHVPAASAGSLTVVLSARAASASVPTSLFVSMAKAAALLATGQAAAGAVSTSVAGLTERVVRGMLVAKLKTAALLVLILAGLGAGAAFVHRALAAEQAAEAKKEAPQPAQLAMDDKVAEGKPPAPDGPPRKLLDIATRRPRFDAEFDGWLSTDALLLALPDKSCPRGKLVRRNLTTGEETPLPALTKLYNQADGGGIPQISPDGQWVPWWDGKVHDVSIYGARLDGSGAFRIPKAKAQWDNLYLFWLRDSRHFVELALTVSPQGQQKFTHVLTRSVDKPDVAESAPIPDTSPLQEAACCVAGTAGSRPSIWSGNGHCRALATSWRSWAKGSTRPWWSGRARRPMAWTVRPAKNAGAASVCASRPDSCGRRTPPPRPSSYSRRMAQPQPAAARLEVGPDGRYIFPAAEKISPGPLPEDPRLRVLLPWWQALHDRSGFDWAVFLLVQAGTILAVVVGRSAAWLLRRRAWVIGLLLCLVLAVVLAPSIWLSLRALRREGLERAGFTATRRRAAGSACPGLRLAGFCLGRATALAARRPAGGSVHPALITNCRPLALVAQPRPRTDAALRNGWLVCRVAPGRLRHRDAACHRVAVACRVPGRSPCRAEGVPACPAGQSDPCGLRSDVPHASPSGVEAERHLTTPCAASQCRR